MTIGGFAERASRYRDKLFRAGNLYSDTFYTSLWVIFGKSFGFFVPFCIPILFSVSLETDLFFFAYYLVLYLLHIFGESLRPVLGPYIAERMQDDKSASAFLSSLIVRISLYLVAIAAVSAVALKPLLALFTPFDAAAGDRIQRLFALGFPIVFFGAWGSCFSAAINLHKKFWVTATAPALRSGAALVIMFALHRRLGASSIMAGFVAGEIAVFLFLWAWSRRLFAFRFRPGGSGDGATRHFFTTASFYMASAALSMLNPIVDRSMASRAGVGSLTLLQYASIIYFIFFSMLVVGFESVLSSYWSKTFHHPDSRIDFRREIMRLSVQVIAVSSCMSVACFALRGSIVALFFRWSEVSPETVSAVKTLFGIYIFALIPAALNIVLQNFFFIRRRTSALLGVNAMNFVSNICFNLLFLRLLGLKGIMIATLLTSTLSVTVQFVLFKRSRFQ